MLYSIYGYELTHSQEVQCLRRYNMYNIYIFKEEHIRGSLLMLDCLYL